MSLSHPTDDTRRNRRLRRQNPNSGWCVRCGIPWNCADIHKVELTPYSGWSLLCESCWKRLKPFGRLGYYVNEYTFDPRHGMQWDDVLRGVLGGGGMMSDERVV
jgi:hypothetical protein